MGLEKILSITVCLFCMLILFVIFLSIHRFSRSYFSQRVFLILLLILLLLFLTSIFSFIADGVTSPSCSRLNHFARFTCFLLIPIPCLLFFFYYQTKVQENKSVTVKMIHFFSIPFLFQMALVIINAYFPYFYSFDENNFYIREKYFFVLLLLPVCEFLVTEVYVLIEYMKETNKEKRKESILMIFLIFFPHFFAMIQLLYTDTFLIWFGATISVVILFIYVQSLEETRDALTTLNNRGQLSIYLTGLMEKGKINHCTCFLIDIDHFKDINDYCGHVIGDNTIIEIANCIKKVCFSCHGFAVRYGGDEFAIISQSQEDEEISSILDEIDNSLSFVNETHRYPFPITVSVGYVCYNKEEHDTIEKFISSADKKMYEMKNRKAKGESLHD